MKVIKWLDRHLEELLLAVLLIAITIVMVVQIIMRYVFQNSLTWAEELSCILLVWSGFLSVSYTLRRNTAMRLTMLVAAFPRLVRNAVLLLTQILVMVFFGLLTTYSLALLSNTQQITPALGLPMVYVYASVLIGCALSTIRAAQNVFRIIRHFKTGDEFHWDPSQEEASMEKGGENEC
ncbi:MAG: TRAP transporter small permease [Eubacteriales bacterium]|nr:TRAP transporter small permease [Eubacteriales bacterium]